MTPSYQMPKNWSIISDELNQMPCIRLAININLCGFNLSLDHKQTFKDAKVHMVDNENMTEFFKKNSELVMNYLHKRALNTPQKAAS